KVTRLNQIAQQRDQTMAQMALAWVAREPAVTSVLIGASSPQQITDNVATLSNIEFTDEELEQIDQILKD
ncbi:MAG: aldo/keto reductase, partial [Bacteroidales bacterium]|nr:aldo/keto reductase [Bacteroidales bacterium]